jgi:hypothetical protein
MSLCLIKRANRTILKHSLYQHKFRRNHSCNCGDSIVDYFTPIAQATMMAYILGGIGQYISNTEWRKRMKRPALPRNYLLSNDHI